MNSVDVIKQREDIEKIKQVLIRGDYRNYLMFIIGINSGLRISQILSLKVSDMIDSENKVVDKITFKEINYPINDCIKESIQFYLQQNNLYKNKKSYIFKSRRGKNQIERTQAYRILKHACKKAGVNLNFGTHTLRKTFGYHFYMQYKDLKYLKKLFNHSNINITANYIGLDSYNDEIEYKSFHL